MRPCRISAVTASATEATPAADMPPAQPPRCAVQKWRGVVKPHAGEHEVLRAALPPAFSYGEGCNGRGKQAAVRCGITLPLPRSASRADDESGSEAAAVIRGTPCHQPRCGSSAGNFSILKNLQDSIGWRKPLRDCFIYERHVNF